MNENLAVSAMHKKQYQFRKLSIVIFIIIIILSSILFIVFPKALPGFLSQIVMLIVMGAVFGLVFLDRISFIINRKTYKKDILHDYLFTHSKPEDIHKDTDLVVELIANRRQAAQELKRR